MQEASVMMNGDDTAKEIVVGCGGVPQLCRIREAGPCGDSGYWNNGVGARHSCILMLGTTVVPRRCDVVGSNVRCVLAHHSNSRSVVRCATSCFAVDRSVSQRWVQQARVQSWAAVQLQVCKQLVLGLWKGPPRMRVWVLTAQRMLVREYP